MNKFEKEIKEALGYVEEYEERPEKGEVFMVVTGSGFNAEDLFKVADLLGTGKIRSIPSTRSDGYCETCYFEYGVIEMTATEVNFG